MSLRGDPLGHLRPEPYDVRDHGADGTGGCNASNGYVVERLFGGKPELVEDACEGNSTASR